MSAMTRALGRGGGGDETVAQLAQRPEHGGDMAVGLRADDVEGGGEVGDGGAAFGGHGSGLSMQAFHRAPASAFTGPLASNQPYALRIRCRTTVRQETR